LWFRCSCCYESWGRLHSSWRRWCGFLQLLLRRLLLMLLVWHRRCYLLLFLLFSLLLLLLLWL